MIGSGTKLSEKPSGAAGIDALSAALQEREASLVDAWGPRLYAIVSEMASVERASIEIRLKRETDDEAAALACNVIVIGNHIIGGLTPRLCREIEQLGADPVPVDLDLGGPPAAVVTSVSYAGGRITLDGVVQTDGQRADVF